MSVQNLEMRVFTFLMLCCWIYQHVASSLPGISCDFETDCAWTWNKTIKGFKVVSGREVITTFHKKPAGNYTGPFHDSRNNSDGHFLFLSVIPGMKEMNVWSPWYMATGTGGCRIEVWLHMNNMAEGNFKVVLETLNHTSWVVSEKDGNKRNMWELYSTNVGSISQEFRLILEVVPGKKVPSHVAIDDIRLVNCFPESPPVNACTPEQFRCYNGLCIERNGVCDINWNCPHGEDEEQDCDTMPQYSRCSFEEGWCGWSNGPGKEMNWTRHSGASDMDFSGPLNDHTFRNETGMYMYVDMSTGTAFGAEAILRSTKFCPPPKYHSNIHSPYYNSCQVRFNYHTFGPHPAPLYFYVVEIHPSTRVQRKVDVWDKFYNTGKHWVRKSVALPEIAYSYYLEFQGIRSLGSKAHVALDDISLSPECFGIGVPPNETEGYVCTNETEAESTLPKFPHRDFQNVTVFRFGTCGARGIAGPDPKCCARSYEKGPNVTVLTKFPYSGFQMWTAPEGGFYTVIAKGASGGKGLNSSTGSSRGSWVRTVVELVPGQRVYMLIGQEGMSVSKEDEEMQTAVCKKQFNKSIQFGSSVRKIKIETNSPGGGGGGGGATYVFLLDKERHPEPLIVAAGGGGLGANLGDLSSLQLQNGRGENYNLNGVNGMSEGIHAAGAGGGWNDTLQYNRSGSSALLGGLGGVPCSHWAAHGGFGGGGGGCSAGGGGGGYSEFRLPSRRKVQTLKSSS